MIARSLQSLQLIVSVAEIDPKVYRYARDYFGMQRPNGRLYIEDARQTLRSSEEVRVVSFCAMPAMILKVGRLPEIRLHCP